VSGLFPSCASVTFFQSLPVVDILCRYRSLKSERRKEIKAAEAALRLAKRKSRGATIPEDADAHGRAPPRLLILYGTQVYEQSSNFLYDEFERASQTLHSNCMCALQTGNAREFAMEVFEEASERGFFATCRDMEVHASAWPLCVCCTV
jgi:hypothetical protein